MNKWIDSLFKTPTENVFIQLFRFGFVGGIAFLVDYGVLILLTEVFSLHYLISATLSFLFGLITNYLLSISWVFSKRTFSNWQAEFLVFAVIGIIGLVLGIPPFLRAAHRIHIFRPHHGPIANTSVSGMDGSCGHP